jgi:hypothetical protein
MTRTRPTWIAAAALGAVLATAPAPSRAAEALPAVPSGGPPLAVPASDPDQCADDAGAADARRRERDAALAEIGHRLSALPPMAPGDRVLKRTGANYDALPEPLPEAATPAPSRAPGASPAPSTTP